MTTVRDMQSSERSHMKIYRNLSDFHGPLTGGSVEIELTPEEIYRAYRLQESRFYAEDIAQNLSDRIEDADDPDHYADDWPMRAGEMWADSLGEILGNNERFGEVFRDMVDIIVRENLEDLGIDPDTMKKREGFDEDI